MKHRNTPPVLRHTQPELLANEERARRGRRVRVAIGLVGGGVSIAVVSAAAAWLDGVAADTAVGIAVGLAMAGAGAWALRETD